MSMLKERDVGARPGPMLVDEMLSMTPRCARRCKVSQALKGNIRIIQREFLLKMLIHELIHASL